MAALATAVLGILVLNFLFIPPVHQLEIRHSQDVVELAVLMIAAVVVGRLAATGRQRAAEAESRAWVAAAREREATLLAEVASAILAGHEHRRPAREHRQPRRPRHRREPRAGGPRIRAVSGRR